MDFLEVPYRQLTIGEGREFLTVSYAFLILRHEEVNEVVLVDISVRTK